MDGTGRTKLQTKNSFFNHLLNSLAFHATFDLAVHVTESESWNGHHMVEDVGLTLGQAFDKAVGNKKGLARFGNAVVPMDDSLVLAAIDLSGRIHFKSNLEFKYETIQGMPSHMVNHFLKSLSEAGKFNLHIIAFRGTNDHHKAEATFKAVGRALSQAVKMEPSRRGEVPSAKGVC